MGTQIERVSVIPTNARELFLLNVAETLLLPKELGLPSRYFVCFLAWDATGVSADVIGAVAEALLKQGAVSIMAWGPDCERVHDIFDEVEVHQQVSSDLDAGKQPPVMTTWHADEPLDEVLWEFLACPVVDRAFEAECRVQVAITIADVGWAEQIRLALSDPEVFLRRASEG